MTFALLPLLLACRLHAAPAPAEAELVDAPAQVAEPSQDPEGWSELSPKLGRPEAEALEALDAYLAKHPGGEPAARAWLEKGRRLENLEQAMQAFKSSLRLGPAHSRSAALAGLELGKLEYAMGRPEAALMVLRDLDGTDLDPAPAAELLYWRGQSSFVLKGWEKAQGDFEAFLKANPGHPLAEPASLAVADCDAFLKNEDAALNGYEKLWSDPPSSVAPQALLEASRLHLKAGRPEKAKPLLERLAKTYPESFEAGQARDLIVSLPASAGAAEAAPTPTTKGADTSAPAKGESGWTIQVGAYARRAGALALFNRLRKRGYAVRLERRVLEDNVLNLIQIGRYTDKSRAARAAAKLAKRERLPYRVVEIR